ncbi:MAG: ATP-grasp domain-containing protein [Spirochaetaceae bacterium]|nr:ATP-grasp domain-containing protein [Myxococcales bacterium]MCB9724307.1 ATP-grasp domain-containing protein [Spirochaetaceae bacterium]
MTGTLLVLGASADQLFMIETARAMGLHVVAIDRNPDSPGFARANESAVVSTRDVPALVELADSLRAKGHRLLGVTTMGSDIPDVVAALAAHLGTPGPSTESARLATDKYAMKCRFRERGIPIPWFERIERAAELHAAVAARGLPLVLKPLDSSGSRGVFLLEPGCDLDALFARSIAYSRIGACLVEEYLPGPQISTETVLWRGRGVTPGFADRNYELLDRFRPQFMENGGWVPSTLDTAERQAVEDLVVRASLALDITDGVTKGDVVMTDEGPKMIELAARLSGGDFCESLVPLGTGVNYVEAAIRIAIGDTPDLDALTPRFERCVANRYFFVEPGRLRRIGGAESLRGEPWLAKLAFWYAAGDTIPPTRSHAERFGVFVVVGRNRDEVQARIDEVYRRVEIVVDRVAESRGVSAAGSGVGVAPTA